MKPNAWFVGVVALFVFAADQAAKFAVVKWIGLSGVWTPVPALAGILAITPGVNTGTACGYLPQFGTLFTFAPLLILAIVILFYRQQRRADWLLSLSTGLIIGGAFGNLADRLRFGYVVDFVYVWHWPVFNVADAAVSTAVVLMLFWSLREDSLARSSAAGQVTAGGETVAASGDGIWKLALSFLVLLAVLAVLGFFVCVYLPARLPL